MHVLKKKVRTQSSAEARKSDHEIKGKMIAKVTAKRYVNNTTRKYRLASRTSQRMHTGKYWSKQMLRGNEGIKGSKEFTVLSS